MKLYRSIGETDTTITMALNLNLASTPGYVQIEDEIIAYQSADSRCLYGCTRGALDTDPASHDAGEDVDVYTPPVQIGDLVQLADDPEEPLEGDMWYNTTDHVVKYYDGTDIQVVAVEA